ncbi:6-carboxytetrahydropterin synthase [Nostoc sp. PA-18-2419]|uniref:6-carboxytetrahydropterin synthase n=1 Tax=Nostoc sp. PA-18-2419 TaxID=2575443 RepID=UPI00110931A9
MKCVINRRAQFCASHRYWLQQLSEAENIEKFGARAKFPGQGHNYVLFISLGGELNEYGMVLNLSDVKHLIKREVTNQLDLSYLNDVWADFEETLPTTENIARIIWQRLASHLPLVRVQLFEHSQLWADYMGEGMEADLTISTHFSAGHRLAPNINPEKYGKCTRTHGHNYHLEITVKGKIDPRTGMIVDVDALKRVVEDYAVEPLDHSYLNKDIPYFAEIVPTTENISLYINNLLTSPIQKLGVELYKVRLFESHELWADYTRNGTETYFTVSTYFSAAHRLADLSLSQEKNTEIYGKCARPHGHGHNYYLEVTVKGQIDPTTGMIVDLGALNQIIKDYAVEPFDHTFINEDIPYFAKVVPTSENIALYISNLLQSPIQKLGAQLYKVKLFESPNNSCEIYCIESESNLISAVVNQPVLAQL